MARDEPSPFGPGNPARPSLRYLFLRFLRHGLLAWGGPVPQLAMMHRELVERDRWIGEPRFRKTLALYQALPGPEAHEMAVFFGMIRRGRVGGLLTGLGFMLPGVVLVTLLAAAYGAFAATTPAIALALYGGKPAVIGLIAAGFFRLARASLRGPALLALGLLAAALGLALPGVNFLLVLAACGVLALLASRVPAARVGTAAVLLPLAAVAAFPALTPAGLLAVAELSAKVGLLTFGGAYTALPFLQRGAVVEHGWMTDAQFLDALALTGLMPGPLVSIGTFVGYAAAGLPGAAVATLFIFAPAFLFTLVGHDFFERLVHEPRAHAFLLGVTAGVVGLVVAVLLPLARAAVVDPLTLGLAVGAAAVLWKRPTAMPLVLGTAMLLGAAAQLAIGG